MTDEEKKVIERLEDKLDRTSDNEITINLLYQKIDLLENAIEKQDKRINELEEVAEYWRKEFERVLTESNLTE